MPPNAKYAKFWDFMLKAALVLIPFGVTFTAWSTRTLLSHESRISHTETWIKSGAQIEYKALRNDILKEAAIDVKLQFTDAERRYESLRATVEQTQRELIQLRAVTESTLGEIQRSQLRIEKTLETR